MNRWALAGVVLFAAGCREKSYEYFYELEQRSERLVDGTGDSAYLSPEMGEIISELDKVPDRAREKQRALSLSAKLQAERARVTQAQTPAPVPFVDSPYLPPLPANPPGQAADAGRAEVGPVAQDAGVGPPMPGMTEEAFLAAYGSCFSPGPTLSSDGGHVTLHLASTEGDCGVRFGSPGARVSWMFIDGKLWGRRTERLIQRPVVDAGQLGTPPQDVTPRAEGDDGGTGLLLIPGAPLPEGLRPVGSGIVDSGLPYR